MTEVIHPDPFNPVLVTPNPLSVTDEQRDNIRNIVKISCADSRFAQKAYIGIMRTITSETLVPTIESLTPDNGVAGGEPVEVTVTGTNFDSGSVVQQAGVDAPTTYVSSTELTVSIALSGAAAGFLAITVHNSAGYVSNTVNFTVTA